LNNNQIISSIVEKHFSLNEESVLRFKDLLENPFKDPIYNNLDLIDGRLKIRIPADELEKYDNGWVSFKIIYKDFYENSGITYNNFISGLFKNKKILKSIKYFYGDRVDLDTIIKFNQSISEKRLPIGKELQIVLSLNFADWFLCSTAENWTSCLDLKSSHQNAFWASLPGLIIDKNRALVYITDGTKKEFCGITTDRFITRSWVLLDQQNILNTVKEYPLKMLGTDIIKDKLELNEIKSIDNDFTSKYPLDFLFNKRNYSIFPYLDNSKLKTIFNKHYILGTNTHGGVYGVDIYGTPYDDSPYNCEFGLEAIIEQEKEIDCYCGKQYSCQDCGIGLTEDYVFFDYAGNEYCEDCFDTKFEYCQNCGKVLDLDGSCDCKNS